MILEEKYDRESWIAGFKSAAKHFSKDVYAAVNEENRRIMREAYEKAAVKAFYELES